eukprot:6203909-Pleurochrysis_carterae.AAC.1
MAQRLKKRLKTPEPVKWSRPVGSSSSEHTCRAGRSQRSVGDHCWRRTTTPLREGRKEARVDDQKSFRRRSGKRAQSFTRTLGSIASKSGHHVDAHSHAQEP